MPKIHVLLKKEELDAMRLQGKAVLVLDILFATTTIATVLANGATEVLPALDQAAALAESRRHPHGSYVIAGELNADTLPGFAAPTPLRLLKEDLAGKKVIYSTTNGTIALRKADGAACVYAGALVNAYAVADHVARTHDGETILIVCSGSADNFNLEDFYGAGRFVDLLVHRYGGEAELSDAALAARRLYRCEPTLECLLASRVGRMFVARGLADEVAFAAAADQFDVVPVLSNGRIRALRNDIETDVMGCHQRE